MKMFMIDLLVSDMQASYIMATDRIKDLLNLRPIHMRSGDAKTIIILKNVGWLFGC